MNDFVTPQKMNYEEYRNEVKNILDTVHIVLIEKLVYRVEWTKGQRGRIFFIGNGGGAGHASHAAADFRKIAGIESYAWGENVTDLTAYTNDYDWERSTEFWLRDNNLTENDLLWVFSVGGGDKHTSTNIVRAMEYCKAEGVSISGIVGSCEGEFAKLNDYGLTLMCNNTPIVEGLQAVLWHMIVSLVR